MKTKSSPIVIAHRGASGYLPEHTLEAKAMAHAQGAHFIEQDLVLSKDAVPVVLHDTHIDTVTDVATRFPNRRRPDGRFYAIDFTLAELKTLRVTERSDHQSGRVVFPKRFPKGLGSFQIPTFEEELALIQGLNRSTGRVAGIYPEIKEPAWHRKEGHDISAIVLSILRRHGYGGRDAPCILQCFELEELRRIRRSLRWRGRLVMLLEPSGNGPGGTDFDHLHTAEGLAELAEFVDGIGPCLERVISPARRVTRLVADAHHHALMVHPYTLRVDELPSFARSADDLLRLLFQRAGVDGVFSDFPDVALRWLEKHG